MLLWKAADQQCPPGVSIAEYGWKIDDGITCPSIDSGPPGPPLLINVISCRCRIVAVIVKNSAAQSTASAVQVMNLVMKKEEMEENDD